MFLIVISSVLMIGNDRLQAQTSDGPPTESIQKAIMWLENDMAHWKETRHCSACHHGPFYLWSISTASRLGFKVNRDQLNQTAKWLFESPDAKIFANQERPTNLNDSSNGQSTAECMKGMKNEKTDLSQSTIYLLLGVSEFDGDSKLQEDGISKITKHLLDSQRDNGSFVGRDAWRPIFNTPSFLTLQVATHLSLSPSMQNEDARKIVTNANAFLVDNPVDNAQQSLVYRIMNAVASPVPIPVDSARPYVEQLLKLQRDDGGWAQTSELESDAFATGQALYALNRFGLDGTHMGIQRALAFLRSTQNNDGTWTMGSRPNPENGKPASNLNPITYAGTAWATIGLCSYLKSHSTSK